MLSYDHMHSLVKCEGGVVCRSDSSLISEWMIPSQNKLQYAPHLMSIVPCETNSLCLARATGQTAMPSRERESTVRAAGMQV